ncbi:hypothetical protein BDF14DRAFT_1850893 [Spinellus fusiger]|nr:hypothetical protein BDF14DRAFT_1850893 [Spinellus fusiger]
MAKPNTKLYSVAYIDTVLQTELRRPLSELAKHNGSEIVFNHEEQFFDITSDTQAGCDSTLQQLIQFLLPRLNRLLEEDGLGGTYPNPLNHICEPLGRYPETDLPVTRKVAILPREDPKEPEPPSLRGSRQHLFDPKPEPPAPSNAVGPSPYYFNTDDEDSDEDQAVDNSVTSIFRFAKNIQNPSSVVINQPSYSNQPLDYLTIIGNATETKCFLEGREVHIFGTSEDNLRDAETRFRNLQTQYKLRHRSTDVVPCVHYPEETMPYNLYFCDLDRYAYNTDIYLYENLPRPLYVLLPVFKSPIDGSFEKPKDLMDQRAPVPNVAAVPSNLWPQPSKADVPKAYDMVMDLGKLKHKIPPPNPKRAVIDQQKDVKAYLQQKDMNDRKAYNEYLRRQKLAQQNEVSPQLTSQPQPETETKSMAGDLLKQPYRQPSPQQQQKKAPVGKESPAKPPTSAYPAYPSSRFNIKNEGMSLYGGTETVVHNWSDSPSFVPVGNTPEPQPSQETRGLPVNDFPSLPSAPKPVKETNNTTKARRVLRITPQKAGPPSNEPTDSLLDIVRNYNLGNIKNSLHDGLTSVQGFRGDVKLSAKLGKVLWMQVPSEVQRSIWGFQDIRDILLKEKGVKCSFSGITTASDVMIKSIIEILPAHFSKTSYFEIHADARNQPILPYKSVVMHMSQPVVELTKVITKKSTVTEIDWVSLDRMFDFQMTLQTQELGRVDVKPYSTFIKKVSVSPTNNQLTFEDVPDFLVIKYILHKHTTRYRLHYPFVVEITRVERVPLVRQARIGYAPEKILGATGTGSVWYDLEVLYSLHSKAFESNLSLPEGLLASWTSESILGKENERELVEYVKCLLLLIEKCQEQWVAKNAQT